MRRHFKLFLHCYTPIVLVVAVVNVTLYFYLVVLNCFCLKNVDTLFSEFF